MRRVRAWREALRSGHLKGRRRWRLVAAVVGFYLIRDLVLYVAIPAAIWVSGR